MPPIAPPADTKERDHYILLIDSWSAADRVRTIRARAVAAAKDELQKLV